MSETTRTKMKGAEDTNSGNSPLLLDGNHSKYFKYFLSSTNERQYLCVVLLLSGLIIVLWATSAGLIRVASLYGAKANACAKRL